MVRCKFDKVDALNLSFTQFKKQPRYKANPT